MSADRMRNHWMNAWRMTALMIVVVVSMANVVHTVRTVPPPALDVSGVGIDPVTKSEQRLAALHASVLARGLKGALGYVGDLPGIRLNEDAHGVEDYFLTQFALVPLVVDSNAESHEWAVANLRTADMKTRVSGNWTIVEEFGAGVALLRKPAR